MPNKAALELVQRFMHNKREFDGTPTRDRLKLIPRIVNVGEWAEKGPLSGEAAAHAAALPPPTSLPCLWLVRVPWFRRVQPGQTYH